MSNFENCSTDDYDSPWKDILEHAFPEFMAFYFPDAFEQIDWEKGHEFKNTELRQVVRDAELGKRFADALVHVTLVNGTSRLVYIHIEIQGGRDNDFAKRMFTYNYRLFDRYDCPIASVAVLADDEENWRPNSYGFDIFGCQHTLKFPVVKLLDYEAQIDLLEAHVNPFALVTVAHLQTRRTKRNSHERYEVKRILVRLLYQQGWDKQRILDLFSVIDWMMRLPAELEQKLWIEIHEIEGENRMRYVTSIERLAIQQGLEQGMQQGIQQGMQQGMQQGRAEGILEGEVAALSRQLTKRFGVLTEEVQARLHMATTEQLEFWIDRILDAPTLQSVFDEH